MLLYAAEVNFREHARCVELLEAWRSQETAWYLTWGIIYEFLRVSTHPKVFRTPWDAPKAWTFIDRILTSPALEVLVETERHRAVAGECIAEVQLLGGNLIHDAHTAILMREHGIGVLYTRDTDFHRFPWVEVRDPLKV